MRIINADTQSIHYTSPQLYTGWSRSIKPLTSRLICVTLSNIYWQWEAAKKIICNRYQGIYIFYENTTLKVNFRLIFFSTFHPNRDFAYISTCKFPFFLFSAWVADVLKNWIPYISYHTLCSPVNVKLRIYRISTLYF